MLIFHMAIMPASFYLCYRCNLNVRPVMRIKSTTVCAQLIIIIAMDILPNFSSTFMSSDCFLYRIYKTELIIMNNYYFSQTFWPFSLHSLFLYYYERINTAQLILDNSLWIKTRLWLCNRKPFLFNSVQLIH